jgi:hypothetical protein
MDERSLGLSAVGKPETKLTKITTTRYDVVKDGWFVEQ